jgi:hypothetical protein
MKSYLNRCTNWRVLAIIIALSIVSFGGTFTCDTHTDNTDVHVKGNT